MQDVGQFTGPGEVKALQQSIALDLATVRDALRRCATAGTFTPEKTAGDWLAWQSMRGRAEAYIAESPSWLSTVSQYERGELVRKELASWHDKARGLGCDAGAAPELPAPSTPLLSFAGLNTTVLILLLLLALKSRK